MQGFQPIAWFCTVFGRLPNRELYQLASVEARQTVIEQLAALFDSSAATITRSTYKEEADKPEQLYHLALAPAPHLLLFFLTAELMVTKAKAVSFISRPKQTQHY